ncbi:hypothetical protein [Glycomyces sp. MUSA5-2]|uniref:hypothetical protein n=1 Tax=Glycomyces sp. MUSA5-2 TaxID=2053002 RepID=UPI0030083E39
MLDASRKVGDAGEAIDRLAHDDIEAPIATSGIAKEVLDAAGAGNRDVELLVGVAHAPSVEIGATALDVVVESDDLRPWRKVLLARVELARE